MDRFSIILKREPTEAEKIRDRRRAAIEAINHGIKLATESARKFISSGKRDYEREKAHIKNEIARIVLERLDEFGLSSDLSFSTEELRFNINARFSVVPMNLYTFLFTQGIFVRYEDIKDLDEVKIDGQVYRFNNGVGTIGSMYNVSTGCEPWFALAFDRNTRLGSYEDGCPVYLEWKKTKCLLS